MFYRGHLAFVLWALMTMPTFAHDPDDPALDQFYSGLMQPDATDRSCCGRADAYFADEVEEQGGRLFAIITDTRDDMPRGRRHIEPGTKFFVPPNKIRRPPSANPTGHTVIFIGSGGDVYCYEPAPLF